MALASPNDPNNSFKLVASVLFSTKLFITLNVRNTDKKTCPYYLISSKLTCNQLCLLDIISLNVVKRTVILFTTCQINLNTYWDWGLFLIKESDLMLLLTE